MMAHATSNSLTNIQNANGSTSVKRRWLLWGSLAVTLLMILLAATELLSLAFLSLTAGGRRGNSTHSYYTDKPWAAEYWEEIHQASPTYFSPYVTWRRSHFRGKYVNVEPTGLRRTVNPNCTPGAAEVWFMGSSTLWGTGARDDQTIPSLFSEQYAKSIGPVCVTNFAEAGWVSTQNVVQLVLALKSAARRPDLVVFDDGFADVFAVYESGRADTHMDYDRIREIFNSGIRKRGQFGYLKESATYRLATTIMSRVERLRASAASKGSARKAPARDLDALAQTAVDNYLQNIRLVDALAKGYGFEYLAFWGPVLYAGQKPLAGPERRILESQMAAAPGLAELSRKTYSQMFSQPHDRLLDLSGVFDSVAADLYLDPSHVTPDGNQLLAARIFEEVRRHAARAPAPR